MRLRVVQDGKKLNELIFDSGPIYIGRHVGSQVFLPERAVSRKHAVIFQEDDGNWFVEDLDSSNKTFVNELAVHKCQLKSGDMIGVCDFKIYVKLLDRKNAHARPPLQLDDTVSKGVSGPNTEEMHAEVRPLLSKTAPMLKIPPKRVMELAKAIRCFEDCDNIKSLHAETLSILLSQLAGRDAWVGFTDCQANRFEIAGGRNLTSQRLSQEDLAAVEYLTEAMDKHHCVLIPQVPRAVGGRQVRSVMMAPVLVDKKCYGALYVNNSPTHAHFESSDLDYMVLLCVHIGVAIERICAFL